MSDCDAETVAAKAAALARLKWRAANRKKLVAEWRATRRVTAKDTRMTNPAQDPLFVYPGELENHQAA